jgi:HK97 family phage major capsid protein
MANKAVEVSEAGAKPQAGLTTAVVTEPIATIAAWANLTRQVAADVPQIQGYLDNRLRYSVKRRADAEVIAGDGSSPNIRGLTNRTGILTNAPGSTEARYITIRHSITLMEQSEAVPEIIVLNPADAELFDLTNSTSAGLHAVMDNDSTGQGALANGPSRTAWGLRQVHSNAIASGTALVIDPMSLTVFDRQQPTAYLTDSHASNFTSNILTLLLEARLGLALFNPLGVLKVTFHD